MNEEYLKRNLYHAKAVGVNAGLCAAIKRLESHSSPPKWLLELLKREQEKTATLIGPLAKYRNLVADNPKTDTEGHKNTCQKFLQGAEWASCTCGFDSTEGESNG